MVYIPQNSRTYNSYSNNNNVDQEMNIQTPPLSNTIDKLLLTLIFTLLAASTVVLPALTFFGSVSNVNILFNVFRMSIEDTTKYHDIPDVYPVGLWNYCYGFTDISTSEWLCIKMKYGFYLNPYDVFRVQTNSLPSGEQISFTNAQAYNLNYTPFDSSGINFLAFILIHVSFVVGVLYFLHTCYCGTRRLFKKGQHGYSLFQDVSRSALVFASLLNAGSAVLVIIMYKRYLNHFADSGVIFEIGKPWQICIWLSILLNIIALILIDIESRYRISLLTKFQIHNAQPRPMFVPNVLQTPQPYAAVPPPPPRQSYR